MPEQPISNSERMPIDVLVFKYMKLRDTKESITRELNQKGKIIDMMMEELENTISARALEDGATSYKTPYGTAFFTETARANVADWDAVLNWIRENDAYDMLTKAVKKDVVSSILETQGFVPPGINYSRVRTFNCRKPTGD